MGKIRFKNRPIIFLDVDGVLNSSLYYEELRENDILEKTLESDVGNISRKSLQLVNDLCIKTDAIVVISSVWRISRTITELRKLFKKCGATFQIVGKTPNIGWARGVEFIRYAIIDDDSDMLLTQDPNFFQVDGYSGLTPNICYKIQRFFENKSIYCSLT
jgi:HAD domain in Swiss Army Knife RNA repair proteins